jgi:hypothetical protein
VDDFANPLTIALSHKERGDADIDSISRMRRGNQYLLRSS